MREFQYLSCLRTNLRFLSCMAPGNSCSLIRLNICSKCSLPRPQGSYGFVDRNALETQQLLHPKPQTSQRAQLQIVFRISTAGFSLLWSYRVYSLAIVKISLTIFSKYLPNFKAFRSIEAKTQNTSLFLWGFCLIIPSQRRCSEFRNSRMVGILLKLACCVCPYEAPKGVCFKAVFLF